MAAVSPAVARASSPRLWNIAQWSAAVVAPLAFILLLDALLGPAWHRETGWRAQRADAIVSEAQDPADLPRDGWRAIQLPDRVIRVVEPASVWYRFDITAGAATTGLWAVYMPRPYATAAVFVNSHAIGDGGPMRPPLPMYRTPLMFTFSSGLLHAGANTVLVHCRVETIGCGLREIHIGPAAAIAPAYQFATLLLVTFKQISVVCLLAMSFVMTALFAMRRRDTAFGWFALALACWAAHISIMLMAHAPLGFHLWTNLNGIALGAFVVNAAFFVNRFIGRTEPRLERVFAAWWLAGAIVLVADPAYFGYSLPSFFKFVWLPGITSIGIYSIWKLIRANRTRRDPELRWLAFASWVVLAVGTRDFWVDAGFLPRQPLYLTYTVGIVLFVFGLIMLRRFVRALDVAEIARAELEVRVAEKTAELHGNLLRMKDLEREQALSAERDRIMRDMHDGVGGQLVQALAVAASDPQLRAIEEPLRTCLEELRLIIDSIEPVDGDLGSVLGTLRVRLKHRLAAAGVRVVWQVADIPQLEHFGPHKVLQVSRIVQEAFANALKHSRGGAIRLRADTGELARRSVVIIEIADDGVGFDGSATPGRGLANMRRRAEDIGGQLDIVSSSRGTVVALLLPLQQA